MRRVVPRFAVRRKTVHLGGQIYLSVNYYGEAIRLFDCRGRTFTGQLFAYRARQRENPRWWSTAVRIRAVTFIARRSKVSACKYGPHIFHTADREVWGFCPYADRIQPVLPYMPLANYEGRIFNLPFNMNTFYQLWKTATPAEAQAKIASQREAGAVGEPGTSKSRRSRWSARIFTSC